MSRYIISTCPPLSSFVPISSRTSTSWVTQDRSAMKPSWHALIRLKTWSLIALNKHVSMTLETTESSDIGLYFSACSLLCFLKTGTMFASCQSSGRQPNLSDLLNNSVSEAAITSAVSFKNLAGNSSGPVALLASRLSRVTSTSDTERISSSERTRSVRIAYANEIQIRPSFNCALQDNYHLLQNSIKISRI